MFPTAFYAYYSDYGKFRSLDHLFADGRRLVYDASYEGAVHGPLTLLSAGTNRPAMSESRWGNLLRRRGTQEGGVWTDKSGRRFSAFAVTPQRILAAGEEGDPEKPRSLVGVVDVATGEAAWTRGLPATVVPGGLAVNHDGLVFAALEDGQLLCLAAE